MADFRIGHMEGLESPWGNAGGVIKKVEDVEKMAQTGVGWIEAGSYTLEPRLGNAVDPKQPELGEQFRVYHHDHTTGETYNSLGMPNQGMEVLRAEIPEMAQIAKAHNKRLIINIAPVTGDPVTETYELATQAYEGGAKNVMLNAGCPNVVTEDGGRKEILSYNPETLGAVLNGLRRVIEQNDPVFVRVSPYQTGQQMREAFEQIRASEVVSAVFLPNAWPNNHPLDENGEDIIQVPGGLAGKSGPGMIDEATVQTYWATSLLRGSKINVVSSSSIMTGSELARRMRIGSVAGAGTTFYYEPKHGWAEDTDRLLHDFEKIHGGYASTKQRTLN